MTRRERQITRIAGGKKIKREIQERKVDVKKKKKKDNRIERGKGRRTGGCILCCV